jgi:hypothetical protein
VAGCAVTFNGKTYFDARLLSYCGRTVYVDREYVPNIGERIVVYNASGMPIFFTES